MGLFAVDVEAEFAVVFADPLLGGVRGLGRGAVLQLGQESLDFRCGSGHVWDERKKVEMSWGVFVIFGLGTF